VAQRILYGKSISLSFFDGSRKRQKLLQMLSSALNISYCMLDFDYLEIKDESGVWLPLQISYIDLLEFQNSILLNNSFQEIFCEMDLSLEKQVFLKKRLMESDNIFGAMYVVNVVSWFGRKNGIDDVHLHLARRLWETEYKEYAQERGVKIYFSDQLSLQGFSNLRKFIQLIKTNSLKKFFTKIIYYFESRLEQSRQSLSRSDCYKVEREKSDFSKPCISVPYWGNINLDSPELQSELFFFSQSPLRGDDVLMSFNLAIDPLNEDKLTELKKHQLRTICLNHQSNQTASSPVFDYHSPKNCSTIPQVSKKEGSSFLGEYSGKALDYSGRELEGFHHMYQYWIQYFRETGARIHVNWYKHNSAHLAISSALKELGGISTIYHRSFDDDDVPKPMLSTATDVVFSFNNNITNEKQIGSIIPYYVSVGYNGDYRFSLLRKPAKTIREKLRKNGATRIIAYFDENTLDDKRWSVGHHSMRLNYETILKRLFEDSELGIIIKPKISSNFRHRLGPVSKMLKNAENSGRCIVFEGGEIHNSYPPSIAALASDIAISGHIYGGTAAFESALAGVPVVILDQEGWPKSRLYDLGIGKVVFRDWDSLWNAFDDFFGHNKIPGFGDWSQILPELDPFRDGKAAYRMGTYLKWLLDGFKDGLDRDIIMADAAERYCKKWGYDKISAV